MVYRGNTGHQKQSGLNGTYHQLFSSMSGMTCLKHGWMLIYYGVSTFRPSLLLRILQMKAAVHGGITIMLNVHNHFHSSLPMYTWM